MNRTAATTTGALLLALVVSGTPALASASDQNGRDRRQGQATRAQSDEKARSRRPDTNADRSGGGRQTRDVAAAQQPRREVAVPRAAVRPDTNTRMSERQSVGRQFENRTVDARPSIAPRFNAPTNDRRQTVAPQYNPRTSDRGQTVAPQYNPRTSDRGQTVAPQYRAPTNDRRQTAAPRYDTRTLDRRQSVAPQYDSRAYTNRAYDSRAYSSRGGYDSRGYSSRGYDSRSWADSWRYDGRRYIYSGYGYRPYVPRYNVRYGLGISIFAGRSFGFRFDYGWAPHYAYRFPIRSGIGYGGMSFLVDPDDAAIYVDGEFIGIASEFGGQPIPLAAGYHEVELLAEGCEPVVFDILVRPGQVIPYRGSLLAIR